MAERPRTSGGTARAGQQLPENFDASELAKQFDQMLRVRRLNELERSHSARPESPSPRDRPSTAHQYAHWPSSPRSVQSGTMSPRPANPSEPQPPSYTSYRSLPLVPSPPQDAASLKFRNLLLTLSITPTKYENPGLLDEALTVIPTERLYAEADEEHQIMLAQAASLGENVKPEWGYQDCIIKSLLRWFKNDFFEFVNNPRCSRCYAPTVAQGMTPPSPDEQARGAARVELYKCSEPGCTTYERFPRYSDVWALLQTKRGRCGEWANCFSMLCRAVGARVRWVWNSEDHVWTEVYSEHQRRWVHVDACEEAWDNPRLYTEGWKKKLAYCIAFSADGASDVTRRYVRNPVAHGLDRTRCPEEVLLWIIQEIRRMRRENTSKEERRRLMREDDREEKELRAYVMQNLASEISQSLPGAIRPDGRTSAEEAKIREGRSTGTAEWIASRGEAGHQTPNPRDNNAR
ncbi:putative protein png1 [Phaeomoniella chlamydospora]|uniref:Protein PNG1 n=1 Tax=Phaeomoniella chlamydospora TaxID=158046 RepID=A0A0G2EB12_PHACM|nr:putative protein png1 [Phaeomoniella chlamydospora]